MESYNVFVSSSGSHSLSTKPKLWAKQAIISLSIWHVLTISYCQLSVEMALQRRYILTSVSLDWCGLSWSKFIWRLFVKVGYNFVSAISAFPINFSGLVWPNQSQHQIISMSMREMSVVRFSKVGTQSFYANISASWLLILSPVTWQLDMETPCFAVSYPNSSTSAGFARWSGIKLDPVLEYKNRI